MPRIFDNKDLPLAPALRETLEQAVALDACVGYLNLRGWGQIAGTVATLPGTPERPPARGVIRRIATRLGVRRVDRRQVEEWTRRAGARDDPLLRDCDRVPQGIAYQVTRRADWTGEGP